MIGRYRAGVSGRGHLNFNSALRRQLGQDAVVSCHAIGRRRRGGGARGARTPKAAPALSAPNDIN